MYCSSMPQRVDAGIPIDGQSLFGIEHTSAGDQAHSQIAKDAPIAQIECIAERRACWRLAKPHVKQLGAVGGQTRLDVAQRLPPRQLGKGHDAKQFGAAHGAHPRVALIALY
jgi:hypothetical protein